MAAGDLEIRKLEPGDRCTGLSCGGSAFTPLKTFLRRRAQRFHVDLLAKSYIAFDREHNRIAAYITLTASQIATEGAPLVDGDYPYSDYPALKIARLLVDERYRGKDIGQSLVALAFGVAQEFICPNVGCRFIVVDSKRESVGFYQRLGFTMLDTEANRDNQNPLMFVDLLKIYGQSRSG
jgi:GNAT superfamily N-acetyltransferase